LNIVNLDDETGAARRPSGFSSTLELRCCEAVYQSVEWMVEWGLEHLCWILLGRDSRVRGRARRKLNALLGSKLATARAWELKEAFAHFWSYKSVSWAQAFPDCWCEPGASAWRATRKDSAATE